MIRRIAFMLTGIVFLAVGCAGLPRGADGESALRSRVSAFWEHKIKGEFDQAYLLESPDVREKISLTNYIKAQTGGVIWRDVVIESVSIKGDLATVTLKINYAFLGMFGPKEGISRQINEYWQFQKDGWYRLQRPPRKGG